MIQQEQSITYHTVMLGPLTREGDTLASVTEQDEAGEQHTRTLHVPAGLPGEVVTIAVEDVGTPFTAPRPTRHRRRWKPRPPRVEITEIHQPSQLRVQAACPVFGVCGGCQLQHMQYSAQLEWKRSVVRQLLQEIGGFTGASDLPLLETVPCENPWHYRNHMRFSVNRSGQPGLTARGTHRVLPLTECPIAHEQINRALSVLSQFPNARPQVLIRCGAATHQMLIQPHPTPAIAQQLANAELDLHTDTMEEMLAGETFRIRPSSFFQTNTAQAEKMVQMVLNGLLDSKDMTIPLTVADAYCGVGTFALLLAPHVSKVIAIEESASAIKDAQWNLREVSNVDIVKGKVEDVLPALAPQLGGLVIDPPRTGCQQVVLDALMKHPVARIVYVSCDPSTLARDLNILCHLPPFVPPDRVAVGRSPLAERISRTPPIYRLRSVQPLDMFPQTAHIECVAVLERYL